MSPLSCADIQLTFALGIFFIERTFGPMITASEAREVLSQFGHLESCYVATQLERASMALNPGVVAEFTLYNEGQKASNVN